MTQEENNSLEIVHNNKKFVNEGDSLGLAFDKLYRARPKTAIAISWGISLVFVCIFQLIFSFWIALSIGLISEVLIMKLRFGKDKSIKQISNQ